jgi:hypothetical protein
MSEVAQLARDEQERVENEPDENEQAEEEEQTPEPEPEPEPAAPEGLTEQETEREFKKLEKLAQTYLTKAIAIADRIGMPYQICPLDSFPGLAIPRQAHEVTSDVEGAVLALIGKSAAPDFKTSQQYERCAECDGWGEVLTGAQKDISRTAICNPCGGKGFKSVIVVPQAPLANGSNTYPGGEVPFTPLPQGIPDAWGRPAGHPHWGSDPAKIGV